VGEAVAHLQRPAGEVQDLLALEPALRVLTQGWLEGEKILNFTGGPLEVRNRLAHAMFQAWLMPCGSPPSEKTV
jgi:hypothetical protein